MPWDLGTRAGSARTLVQRIKQERHDRENEETKRTEWDEGGGQRAREEE